MGGNTLPGQLLTVGCTSYSVKLRPHQFPLTSVNGLALHPG